MLQFWLDDWTCSVHVGATSGLSRMGESELLQVFDREARQLKSALHARECATA